MERFTVIDTAVIGAVSSSRFGWKVNLPIKAAMLQRMVGAGKI